MQKVICIIVLMSLIGCASTKSTSNFEDSYNLKNENVVVATIANDKVSKFAEKLNSHVSNYFSANGVKSIIYSDNKDEVALSDNPILDYAKENGANFIFLQTLKKVSIYNTALYGVESEISIICVEDNEVVWRGIIDYKNPMATVGSYSKGVKAVSSEIVQLLKKDKYLMQ